MTRWTLRKHLRGIAGITTALLVLHLAPEGAPQNPSQGALGGVVKMLRTNQPIEGARVFLLDALLNERSFTPTPTAMVWTNGKGEFVFQNLDAGSYQIVVAGDGYVKRDSPRLVLASQQRLKDIVFRLTPAGNVSGRVSSTSGKPLAGITVTLLRPAYDKNGTRQFNGVATVYTNDLGEYRLYWITPGKYYVMADGSSEPAASAIQDQFDTTVRYGWNNVSENYAQTFYPGTTDIARASTIDLSEGAELRGIDLTLSRQQPYSIRGHLIDATTGKPPTSATVNLTSSTLTGNGVMEGVDYDVTTGAFEISGLRPGRYVVSAHKDDESRPYPSYSPPGVPWDDRELSIAGTNVDIELKMAIRPIITGQIRLEGALPAGTTLDKLRISLFSTGSLPPVSFEAPSASSDMTGKFSIAAQQEGSYRVKASGLPEGFYLKDARLNDADVLNGSAGFSASGNLNILIGQTTARVDGRVIDEQQHAVAGVEAILIPDDHRNRAELFKRAVTDHEGRFSIPGIAPGDYKIFAWENIETNSYFDEAVVQRFEQRGTRVRVTESSRTTVEVKRIPEEAAP
jgi:hypothetical protein